MTVVTAEGWASTVQADTQFQTEWSALGTGGCFLHKQAERWDLGPLFTAQRGKHLIHPGFLGI